ncbi:hypothetical protein LN461_14165 [Xanthomonas arboricola]|uniref:hypothetical protein n=1 Tax=Xanthomonas arboricola TaxID=56448 RepID=UPI001E56EDF3|nr:hypothetical protein [Xanthomonas arboricola]MCC8670479.1 hypothetical protein [Xanthomonas arboricola]
MENHRCRRQVCRQTQQVHPQQSPQRGTDKTKEESLHIRRLPESLANEGLEMVAEDGIEPPTRGFSIPNRKSK